MVLRNTPLPLFSIVLSILLLSCSTPKELEYRDFKNFSVEKLGFSTTSVKMDLIYFNPNSFGMQLKQADLDIFVNNNYLGHTLQDYQVAIPKKAEFSIPIKLEVDMKNLFKNGLATLLNKEVMVKVTGKVKVGKANVFMSIPVNYEGKQNFSLF
jgi:LEA14-like dessication related protein